MDADDSTLHGAIFLEVVYHLIHNRGRDGKTVATERACLRIEHGVDADKFATCVHQGTARVARIDGGISLNERFYAILIERASLCAYNTCGNCIGKVERVAYSQYPFAHLDILAVGNGDGRQVLAVYLYECKVGSLVGTDDASRIFLVVVKCYGELVGISHNVVVGNDISIC